MSVLVTGASGFLGKHLVALLRADTTLPRLRVLNYGPNPFAGDSTIDVVDGSITNRADVEHAMEGCRQVYHLAGSVSRDPRHKERMYDLHVEGTRNICEAALRYRPEKVVVVSSSGTIAVSIEPVAHDEASGFKSDVLAGWHYYLSKIEAEKVVLDYVARHALPVVIANPALLLGPGDDLGSSTRDIVLLLEGRLMAMPRGGMCFVDARDAAAGLVAAMRSGRVGERYLLGGVNRTFKEIAEAVGRLGGVRTPRLSPPLSVSLASARLLRRLMPLAGRSFPVDDTTIRMSFLFWYCDSSKAKAELGFCTRDPDATIRDTIAYLRQSR